MFFKNFAPGFINPQFSLKGQYFAARLKNPRNGSYSLVTSTVSPGFEYHDWELVSQSSLLSQCPQHQEIITALSLTSP